MIRARLAGLRVDAHAADGIADRRAGLPALNLALFARVLSVRVFSMRAVTASVVTMRVPMVMDLVRQAHRATILGRCRRGW
jgi:hypothetical protein